MSILTALDEVSNSHRAQYKCHVSTKTTNRSPVFTARAMPVIRKSYQPIDLQQRSRILHLYCELANRSTLKSLGLKCIAFKDSAFPYIHRSEASKCHAMTEVAICRRQLDVRDHYDEVAEAIGGDRVRIKYLTSLRSLFGVGGRYGADGAGQAMGRASRNQTIVSPLMQ